MHIRRIETSNIRASTKPIANNNMRSIIRYAQVGQQRHIAPVMAKIKKDKQ